MGKWWLVTWTTYGSWLPGDPRGYRTWRKRVYVPPPARFAQEGEPIYEPERHAARHRIARAANETEVTFSDQQKQLVFESVLDQIAVIEIPSAALSVGAQHVHWLAYFTVQKIRPTVGRIKAKATAQPKRLRREAPLDQGLRHEIEADPAHIRPGSGIRETSRRRGMPRSRLAG